MKNINVVLSVLAMALFATHTVAADYQIDHSQGGWEWFVTPEVKVGTSVSDSTSIEVEVLNEVVNGNGRKYFKSMSLPRNIAAKLQEYLTKTDHYFKKHQETLGTKSVDELFLGELDGTKYSLLFITEANGVFVIILYSDFLIGNSLIELNWVQADKLENLLKASRSKWFY